MAPQCNDEQIQGTSGQKGQDGFATSSGTLPCISLMALEERHLGVGLSSGSHSSPLLRGSLPTSAFCSHSGVGCYEDTGRKKSIVGIMSLFSYLVTNLHQQLGQKISWAAQRGQFYLVTEAIQFPFWSMSYGNRFLMLEGSAFTVS